MKGGSGPEIGYKLTEFGKQVLDDPTVKAWLDSFLKKTTQDQYRSRIVKFLEAVNKTPAELRAMSKSETVSTNQYHASLCGAGGF